MTVSLHLLAQLYFLLASLARKPSPHGGPCQTQICILTVQQLHWKEGASFLGVAAILTPVFHRPVVSYLPTPEQSLGPGGQNMLINHPWTQHSTWTESKERESPRGTLRPRPQRRGNGCQGGTTSDHDTKKQSCSQLSVFLVILLKLHSLVSLGSN